MNQKIKQLETVLKVEDRKVLSALAKYNELSNQHKTQELQCEQLIEYSKDYRKKTTAVNQQPMTVQILQTYTHFIAKLDIAIDEQKVKVKQSKILSDQHFSQYLATKQKAEAIQRLIDVEYEYENILDKRQEQKNNDETASTQWYSRCKN